MSPVIDLITRHPAEWRAATHHLFLEGVRAGSLPSTAFRSWLVQDYLFVSDLLQFQAQLLSLAPRLGQPAVAKGLVGLVSELDWFESHAKRMQLKLDAKRHPTTESYGQRLHTYAKDWAVGITALWAGERAYLESWSQIAPGAPTYHEFVEHWTHPDFAAYVGDLEKLVDAAGPVEEAFVSICDLERDFWEMAWSSALA